MNWINGSLKISDSKEQLIHKLESQLICSQIGDYLAVCFSQKLQKTWNIVHESYSMFAFMIFCGYVLSFLSLTASVPIPFVVLENKCPGYSTEKASVIFILAWKEIFA